MIMNWIVYLLISPSKKVYVGITSKEPHRRWSYGNNYSIKSIIRKAIDKYGWDNFKHIVFCKTTESKAKLLEKTLIGYYKRHNRSYNITDGGDGILGYRFSDEQKAKMSIIQKNKAPFKWSEEAKNRNRGKRRDMSGLNNPNYGNHKIAGKNNFMYGKTHTEEAKRKISIANTGRTHKMSEYQKELLIKRSSKPVIQLDIENNIIAKFNSAAEAARFYGKGAPTANHIAECCRGKRNKCMNFKWIYNND